MTWEAGTTWIIPVRTVMCVTSFCVTFMACAYCYRYHRIDQEGKWGFDSPEEEQEHMEAVKRTKGAT